MSEVKDGGHAFPINDLSHNTATGEAIQHQYIEGGLSVRDWFAGKAMAACISQCAGDTRIPGESQAELIARRSYELADAMIKAREA